MTNHRATAVAFRVSTTWCQDAERRCQEPVLMVKGTAERKARQHRAGIGDAHTGRFRFMVSAGQTWWLLVMVAFCCSLCILRSPIQLQLQKLASCDLYKVPREADFVEKKNSWQPCFAEKTVL